MLATRGGGGGSRPRAAGGRDGRRSTHARTHARARARAHAAMANGPPADEYGSEHHGPGKAGTGRRWKHRRHRRGRWLEGFFALAVVLLAGDGGIARWSAAGERERANGSGNHGSKKPRTTELTVRTCDEFRRAIEPEANIDPVVVVDSLECGREMWGNAVKIRRNITIVGRLEDDRMPLIDWKDSDKAIIAGENTQVEFRDLIFVQDDMGIGSIDLSFFGNDRFSKGLFKGIVVGVQSCPLPISTYGLLVSKVERPPEAAGMQRTSEIGANTLLVEDMAVTVVPDATWKICQTAFHCGALRGNDRVILRELLIREEVKAECPPPIESVDPSSPQPPGPIVPPPDPPPAKNDGSSLDTAILVIAVVAFAAVLMVCVIATVVVAIRRRRQHHHLIPPEGIDDHSRDRALVLNQPGGENGDGILFGAPCDRFGCHWNFHLSDVQIDVPLGRGGFGRVYRGSWQGTTVAVKIIRHTERLLSTNTGEPLEAFLSRRISHPNVVQTFHISTKDVGSDDEYSPGSMFDTAGGGGNDMASGEDIFSSFGGNGGNEAGRGFETWIVLEFCDKGSLAAAIEAGEFIFDGQNAHIAERTFSHVILTALEIAKAMNYLHSVRIIHGDLKPGNVLLKGDPHDQRGFTCKVGDFGLSRFLAEESQIETFTCGTVTHMPPELLKGGVLTPAADVYSFGVLLWELLSGQKPYVGKNQGEIILTVVNRSQRPPLPPHFPEPYARLVNDCWAQDHELRPTFPQLIDRLEAMLDRLPDSGGDGDGDGGGGGHRSSMEEVDNVAQVTQAVRQRQRQPQPPSPPRSTFPKELRAGQEHQPGAISAFRGLEQSQMHGVKKLLTAARSRGAPLPHDITIVGQGVATVGGGGGGDGASAQMMARDPGLASAATARGSSRGQLEFLQRRQQEQQQNHQQQQQQLQAQMRPPPQPEQLVVNQRMENRPRQTSGSWELAEANRGSFATGFGPGSESIGGESHRRDASQNSSGDGFVSPQEGDSPEAPRSGHRGVG